MKILIILNGKTSHKSILGFSTQFAHRAGEPPTILLSVKDQADQLLASADQALDAAREQLGIPEAQTMKLIGPPAEQIIRVVREGGFNLVILGFWTDSSIKRIWRKPVPFQVAEAVDCPILIVKGVVRPVQKILLCDSGAGKSSVLSRFILQLAELLEGEEEVTVLHVMSQISAGPGVRGKELRANAEELIREKTLEGKLLDYDVHVLSHPGLRPFPKVRHGLVVDEILAEARSEDYDLIVIGAHDTQTMKRLLLENIAEEILQQANRSVLVVR